MRSKIYMLFSMVLIANMLCSCKLGKIEMLNTSEEMLNRPDKIITANKELEKGSISKKG